MSQNKRNYKRKGRKRNFKQNSNRVFVPFRDVLNIAFAASSTVSKTNIETSATSFSQRLATIGVGYQFYRFRKLKFSVNPCSDSTTAGNNYAFGYIPNVTGLIDTASYGSLAEYEAVRFHAAQKTVNTVLVVPQSVLRTNPSKMFTVETQSSGVDESIQGKFYFAPRASSTSTITIEVTGVVEFIMPAIDGRDLLIRRLQAIEAHVRVRPEATLCASEPISATCGASRSDGDFAVEVLLNAVTKLKSS